MIVPANHTPTHLEDFPTALGNGLDITGAWTEGEWDLQFNEEFDGASGTQLSDRTPNGNDEEQWFFAQRQNNQTTTIFPATERDTIFDDQHAEFVNDGGDDGVLKMTIDDSGYSYMASGTHTGAGYQIDASNGVFVETAVRFDEALAADQAWWAFWLMTPGGLNTGNPADDFAYNNNATSGSEVDIFEYVPDSQNGFNTAIFKRPADVCTEGVADDVALRPDNRCFTYQTPDDIAGLGFEAGDVNYLDGNYHRLGMYYDHTRYEIYIDDVLILRTTDPAWITDAENLTLRLTWELQNVGNHWTRLGGNFADTFLPEGQDPTVYIDYVKVWEKVVPTDEGTQDSWAMDASLRALESYGAENGTYRVDGGGWGGNGQGWFHFDNNTKYTQGVGAVLVAEGHADRIEELQDTIHINSTRTFGDFLIYRCKDRVAVFSRHGGASDTSAADREWWDSNGCNRNPIDRLGGDSFKLSAPL